MKRSIRAAAAAVTAVGFAFAPVTASAADDPTEISAEAADGFNLQDYRNNTLETHKAADATDLFGGSAETLLAKPIKRGDNWRNEDIVVAPNNAVFVAQRDMESKKLLSTVRSRAGRLERVKVIDNGSGTGNFTLDRETITDRPFFTTTDGTNTTTWVATAQRTEGSTEGLGRIIRFRNLANMDQRVEFRVFRAPVQLDQDDTEPQIWIGAGRAVVRHSNHSEMIVFNLPKTTAALTNMDGKEIVGHNLKPFLSTKWDSSSMVQRTEPFITDVDFIGSTAIATNPQRNYFTYLDLDNLGREERDYFPTKMVTQGDTDFWADGKGTIDLIADGKLQPEKASEVLHGYKMAHRMAVTEIGGNTYTITPDRGVADQALVKANSPKQKVCTDPKTYPEPGKYSREPYGKFLAVAHQFHLRGNCFNFLELSGGRGFTIRDKDGREVYTSGMMMREALDKAGYGKALDKMSNSLGVAPFDVATATVGDKTYAFMTLTSVGGIFVVDITEPTNAQFVQYTNISGMKNATSPYWGNDHVTVHSDDGKPVLYWAQAGGEIKKIPLQTSGTMKAAAVPSATFDPDYSKTGYHPRPTGDTSNTGGNTDTSGTTDQPNGRDTDDKTTHEQQTADKQGSGDSGGTIAIVVVILALLAAAAAAAATPGALNFLPKPV